MVRIKVQACGICHSDEVTRHGLFPGIQYPRVPGHEVIGVIDGVGQNVPRWTAGQRVGVGWNGGYCGYCDSCRRGNFFACETSIQVTGVTRDGGYADYMIAPASAIAVVPAELSAEEGAPLMCAGVTTFNCLRNSGARPGDVVAVIGLGGLGHLGIQFAARSGFKTVGIGRGKDKEALARKLGASHYIDSAVQDPAAELQKLGGAKVILATVTSADAMKAVIGGLTPAGTLMIVGVDRFPGNPRLQCALRRAVDERKLPAGTGERGLRADGARQSQVPGSSHHGEVIRDKHRVIRPIREREACTRDRAAEGSWYRWAAALPARIKTR
jgi:D-arabinose 1-dehydrogenase-like Zn-dependent alcohol dehydrogenase